MAQGLGFIEFATGDVLSAAAANGYLASQTVMVFASAAARTSAIATPYEGMFSYLKDTNATQYYDGAAWTNLDTTGMVNPMTTTGDTIYSSSGTTPARLGIGSTGQVLTVAAGLPSWATPASGGMTLLSTTSLTGAAVTISSISGSYKHLLVIVKGVYMATAGNCAMTFNGDTGSNYSYNQIVKDDASVGGGYNSGTTVMPAFRGAPNTAANQKVLANAQIFIPLYTATDFVNVYIQGAGRVGTTNAGISTMTQNGTYDCSAAISSITFTPDYNFSGGTVYIYGVN